MKCLLVDGSHLMHRCAFAQSSLIFDGQPVGATFGVFNSLKKMTQDYPLHHVLIAWDRGHARRDIISEAAVVKGIIPEAYKANRGGPASEEVELVRWQMKQQWDTLKEAIALTRFQQVEMPGREADDIIATYAMSSNDPCIIISSDQDFYQLLEDGVEIRDPLSKKTVTFQTLADEYGLVAAEQWVHVGALMGDDGDNIFGVSGVGIGTATKLIAKYGRVDVLMKYIKELTASGKEVPKRLAAILENEERVGVAYALKRMDLDIQGMPAITPAPGDPEKLGEFFTSLSFSSLMDSLDVFV